MAKFTINELLNVLKGKLSNSITNLVNTVLSLGNIKSDLSKLNATITLEISDINGNKRITGRSFHLFGDTNLKGTIIQYNLSMDITMSAIVFYDNNICKITENDLLLK